jgi:hypothetical protein
MSKNTNIIEVTQAIEDRLLLKLPTISPTYFETFNESQIIWTVDDNDIPPLGGNYDIVLRINSEQNIYSRSDGGGRAALLCSQMIDVIVRTKTALSQLGNDKKKIEKHYLQQQPVLDALAEYMPADADGFDILSRPFQWRSSSSLSRQHNPPARNLWVRAGITLEAHFRPLINPLDFT